MASTVRRFEALFAFNADPSDPEQLDLVAGTVVLTNGEDIGGGWVECETLDGRKGVVPKSYLQETPSAAGAATEVPSQQPAEILVTEETVQPQTIPPPPASLAVENINDHLKKYRMMRKAGLPQGAIEHALRKDGLDPNTDLGFGPEVSTAAAAETRRDDVPSIEKYKRMEAAGLPMGAILNAMNRDEVDPKLMYGEEFQAPELPPPQPLPIAPRGQSLMEQIKMASALRPAFNSANLPSNHSPPRSAAAATTAPGSATNGSPSSTVSSPMNEIQRLALERQKRVSGGGGTSPASTNTQPSPREFPTNSTPPWANKLRSTQSPPDAKTTSPSTTQFDEPKSSSFHRAHDGSSNNKRNQEEASHELETSSPTKRHTGKACSSYKLDLTSSGFAQCVCGFTRAEHPGGGGSGVTPSSPTEGFFVDGDSEERAKRRAAGVICSDYKVDMTSTTFAMCLCGFPKTQHGGTSSPASVSLAPTPPVIKASGPMQPEPCKQYRVDVLAATFGACVCGWDKKDHFGNFKPPQDDKPKLRTALADSGVSAAPASPLVVVTPVVTKQPPSPPPLVNVPLIESPQLAATSTVQQQQPTPLPPISLPTPPSLRPAPAAPTARNPTSERRSTIRPSPPPPPPAPNPTIVTSKPLAISAPPPRAAPMPPPPSSSSAPQRNIDDAFASLRMAPAPPQPPPPPGTGIMAMGGFVTAPPPTSTIDAFLIPLPQSQTSTFGTALGTGTYPIVEFGGGFGDRSLTAGGFGATSSFDPPAPIPRAPPAPPNVLSAFDTSYMEPNPFDTISSLTVPVAPPRTAPKPPPPQPVPATTSFMDWNTSLPGPGVTIVGGSFSSTPKPPPPPVAAADPFDHHVIPPVDHTTAFSFSPPPRSAPSAPRVPSSKLSQPSSSFKKPASTPNASTSEEIGCLKCTFLNPPRSTVCEICGYKLPKITPSKTTPPKSPSISGRSSDNVSNPFDF